MPSSAASSHPSLDLLSRFSSGELAGAEAEAIRKHLEACAVCQKALSERKPTADESARPSGNELTCAFTGDTSAAVGGKLPECVGRYRIEYELARGGMGQVVRVVDGVFQRPLAMKIALGQTQERFQREALLTGQLQHPGIPPVQEMGTLDDGRPYFIMKLVKGSDLGALLRQRAALGAELPRWVAIFGQVCQTLGYAHSHGIIHRDLKPSNVMVGAFGEVQVMDWGLAKLLTSDRTTTGLLDEERPTSTVFTLRPDSALPQETMPGTVMGTSAYMPPEQARGEAETLDPRSDVFGLGAILCEILTGKPPFTEPTSLENQRRSMRGDLAGAFARLEDCGADRELVDLARHCLAPDRNDRPVHAGVVAEAVARYQADLQQRIQQAEIARAAALVKAAEERKRRRMSLALTAALVLLTAGSSAFALWYQAESSRQRRHTSELALRRQYLTEEVSTALADAEAHRAALLKRVATQSTVNELLSDIDLWQRLLADANAPLQRARALADGSPDLVDANLAERLRTLEKHLAADGADWKFGKACDDARLAAVVAVDGTWNPKAAARLYPPVLAAAGLDLKAENEDRAVMQLKQSPIRLVFLAALDDWADVAHPELRERIFALANKVDDDPWRQAFRKRSVWQDGAQLRKLADQVDLREQSPQILVALASRLAKPGDGAALLRRAQGYHPRDFWIFFSLGRMSSDPVAQEGCYRAALAIRPRSSPAHNNLAVALRSRNDFDGAIRHYRAALAINPGLLQAQSNLAYALWAKKDLDEAMLHARKAIVLDPNLADAHYTLGLALQDKKDLPAAIAEFRTSLRLNENSAEAHFHLAMALHEQGELEGAITHWRRSLDINPKHAQAYYNLANSLLANGDESAALEQYRKAVAVAPTLAEAQYNVASLLRRRSDAESAFTHYLKVIESKPDFAEAHVNLGVILFEKKDSAAAEKYFRRALEINPELPQAHNGLGLVLREKKDLRGAIEHFRKAIALDARRVEPYGNLGSALTEHGDGAGAIEAYRSSLQLDASQHQIHSNLGQLLQKRGDLAAALEHLRQAVALKPDAATAHGYLAIALHAAHDAEGAIRHFRRASELDPKNARYLTSLGAAYSLRKDAAEAIRHFRKALELDPTNASIHRNLGIALQMANDIEGAIREYRKSLELDANDPVTQSSLGKLLGVTNQTREAIQHYRKSLELRPRNAEAHAGLARVLLKAEDWDEACTHFRQAMDIDPKNAPALRYQAACAAVLAARDGAKRSDKDRTELRRQALEWLHSDLASRRERLDRGTVEDVLLALYGLPRWQREPALAGVREGLPEGEQPSWQQLWNEVAQILKQGRGRFLETPHEGALTEARTEQVHEVKLLAGKTYVFDLESTQFDAYLRLQDGMGKIRAENDDISAADRNARLVFSPEQTGVYRVIATSFQQKGTGAYTLTIREFISPDGPPNR